MNKSLTTVLLLIGSNCFMTWAWYGHLKKSGWTIPVAIVVSWLIAFFEYTLQVPANRIGHISHGGPFDASQLKIIQESITIGISDQSATPVRFYSKSGSIAWLRIKLA